MKHNRDYLSAGILIVWVVTLILLCMEGLRHAGAQDTPIEMCSTSTDAGVVFTFSNIPDTWFDGLGWYYIGEDVQVDGHTLTITGLQFDNGYSYAVVGKGDYSENITATTEITPACVITPNAPQNTANDRVEPLQGQIASNSIVSTGTVCVVKYPQVILVCTPHGN